MSSIKTRICLSWYLLATAAVWILDPVKQIEAHRQETSFIWVKRMSETFYSVYVTLNESIKGIPEEMNSLEDGIIDRRK